MNRTGFGGTSLVGRIACMPKQNPRELRERAVRPVAFTAVSMSTECAAILSVAAKLGIATPEPLPQ
jgi:hypothetical protein